MQQSKHGGMIISLDLGSYQNVTKFLQAVKIPLVAVSLGGIESIISYPAKMSHACVSPEDRLKQGVTDGLLRYSVGCEDAEDLIEDLKQALEGLEG